MFTNRNSPTINTPTPLEYVTPISSSPPPDLSLQPAPQIPVTCCSNCWALPHYHHHGCVLTFNNIGNVYSDKTGPLEYVTPISSSPPPDLSLQPSSQIPVTCCSNCWALPHYHHYHSYEEEAYRDGCKELKREASLPIKYAVSVFFPTANALPLPHPPAPSAPLSPPPFGLRMWYLTVGQPSSAVGSSFMSEYIDSSASFTIVSVRVFMSSLPPPPPPHLCVLFVQPFVLLQMFIQV